MDTLLDALQEGRLFELPDDNKADSLEFLAHIMEAFPEVPSDTDAYAYVMKKEEETKTTIGHGWACTHVRVPIDEALMCVVGWSPEGIAYGDEKVYLVVMYLVPENQRSHYLREVSTIARGIEEYKDTDKLSSVDDLNGIRNYLLDMIDYMKESSETSARARMIRLQAKPAEPVTTGDLRNLLIEPVKIITGAGIGHIALTQNIDLQEWADGHKELADKLEADGSYINTTWRIISRGSMTYQGGRTEYDCIAIKTA